MKDKKAELSNLQNVIISIFVIAMLIVVTLLFLTSMKENMFESETNSTTQSILSDNGTATTLIYTPTSLSATHKNQTWLEFDGVNDLVNLTDDDGFSFNNNITTISIWYKFPSSFSQSYTGRVIYGKGKASNYEYMFWVKNSTSNVSGFVFWNLPAGSQQDVYLTSTAWGEHYPNVWNNAIVTMDGDYISTYLNGEAKDRDLIVIPFGNGNADLLLGQRTNPISGAYFNGSIDDFRIYNNSFKPLQIINLTQRFSRTNNLTYIPVLSYHEVDTTAEIHDINISQFSTEMAYLNASGYETITDVEYYNWTQGNFILPEHPVMITFDDGYGDTYWNATPVMDLYGYKGVMLIITGIVDLNEANSLGYMNWTQINELIAKNWSIASHSQTHCDLGYGSGQDVYCNDSVTRIGNLSQSKQDIIDNTGVTPISFVFPYNDHGDKLPTGVYKTQVSYPEVMGNCSLNYTLCWGSGYVPLINVGIPRYITEKSLNFDGVINKLSRIAIENNIGENGFDYALNYTMPELDLQGQWNINENTGTTAYDVSGNANNGTIDGATWNDDGVDITLTENTDYILSSNVFTIINSNLAWTGINTSYNYNYSSTVQESITDMETNLTDFIPWIGIILLVVAASIVLVLVIKSFREGRI